MKELALILFSAYYKVRLAIKRKIYVYWSSGVQLDLVFKRADLVYTVCEIKYRCTDSASEHGTKLDQAIAKITALKDKTIQKVLITGSTSKKVSADGLHFSKVLTVENLF